MLAKERCRLNSGRSYDSFLESLSEQQMGLHCLPRAARRKHLGSKACALSHRNKQKLSQNLTSKLFTKGGGGVERLKFAKFHG